MTQPSTFHPALRAAAALAAALSFATTLSACGGGEDDAIVDDAPPATFSDPTFPNDDRAVTSAESAEPAPRS